MNIDYFGNDKYRVLACMAKRQISVNGNSIIKLSQQEIAEIVQLSKAKVNAIIAELKDNDYISQASPRGKYSLTEKAVLALDKMQQEVIGL